MALFLIAIVGLLLAILSQHSLTLAGDAARLRRDVQNKWALASLQRYGIEFAPMCLKSKPDEPPLQSWHQTVILNETGFDFWVVDESAKLNLNVASRFMSEEALANLAGQLIEETVSVRLNPLSKELQDGRNDPFESWGQVIEIPAEAKDPAKTIRDATEGLTCWGTRLNWRTAHEKTLREAVKVIAGGSAAAQVVQASRDRQSDLEETIALVARNERQRLRLSRLLGDHSSTFAIWVRKGGPYPLTTLTINETVTESVERTVNFTW
jgi:hypothetical protein